MRSSVDLSIAITDRRYPARVRKLRDAPPILYVRGQLPKLSPSAAIVGSRRATEEMKFFAEELAFELALGGVTIVSGGALGIDGAAHRGAVRASRPTIVVLPTSLAHPSPRSHRELFDQVLDAGGAWISEHDRIARRSDFRTRNRIIAALADLVIVVQADKKSGTRHTVAAATKLKRTIAAVPWSPGDPRGEMCVEILKKHGPAITSSRDVFALLGVRAPRAPRVRGQLDTDHAPLEVRILAALKNGPATHEMLARSLAVDAGELLVRITELEVGGVVTVTSNGSLACVGIQRQCS